MGWFYNFVQFFRFYFDLVIDKIFGWYYDSSRVFIEKPANQIVLESASSLAKKIQKQEVTSEEIVKTFIERINQVNPLLNAIVDDRFPEALDQAREVDRRIKNLEVSENEFSQKPFLGVPFTIKESTSCQGLSNTMGLRQREGHKATFDADHVRSIKNAGGLLLGVSNIPQYNLWQETNNPVFGLTKNPYDTTKTVGGSAGGEATILAACGSPFSAGGDSGGSLRIPSLMCGIFGHKLTSHLVSTKGIKFRTTSEEHTLCSIGPLTRYAEDLIPLTKVLVGEHVDELNLDDPVDVSKLKIYYVTDPEDIFCSPISEEVKDVLTRTVEYFKETCVEEPEEIHFEGFKYTALFWRYWKSREPNTNLRNDVNDRKGEVSIIKETIKHFTVGGDFTTGTIVSLVNLLLPVGKEKWILEETERLKNDLLSKLDDNSVLLYHSAPLPAGYHYTSFLRPLNFAYFALWNVMQFPVTQVPMGLNKEGLPLGLQVVALPFQDRLCFAVAKELEKTFGGYVPPFN